MIDEENGGFYGRIDGFNQLHPTADKGIILSTRLLWGFASAARILDEPKYQQVADRAYHYLIDPDHMTQESWGLFDTRVRELIKGAASERN